MSSLNVVMINTRKDISHCFSAITSNQASCVRSEGLLVRSFGWEASVVSNNETSMSMSDICAFVRGSLNR